MNILVDPNPLFDPKNSQFWLFLSKNEIFGVSGKNELRVSMGPKCWFFVYFFFGAPPKKPTLWPRGDKKVNKSHVALDQSHQNGMVPCFYIEHNLSI